MGEEPRQVRLGGLDLGLRPLVDRASPSLGGGGVGEDASEQQASEDAGIPHGFGSVDDWLKTG
jgi:hypothetical protein